MFALSKTRFFQGPALFVSILLFVQKPPKIRAKTDQKSINMLINNTSQHILMFCAKMMLQIHHKKATKIDPETTSGSEMCQSWSKRAPKHQF